MYVNEKSKRLTASNFGLVVKRRDTTSPRCLLNRLLSCRKFRSPAMSYGTEKESVARSRFEREYDLVVSPAGLFIDLKYGFLGASPDGQLHRPPVTV